MPKQNGPYRKESSWRPIVDAIATYQQENGYPPCMSDIAAMVGKSHTTIRFHIDKLVADGIVTREPGRVRTLRVVEKGRTNEETTL